MERPRARARLVAASFLSEMAEEYLSLPLVPPSSDLQLKLNVVPTDTHALVSGDANLYLDYAKKLANESTKVCAALPFALLLK